LKCPTCPDALFNRCCRCVRTIPVDSQSLAVGPVRSIYDSDFSLHLFCVNCYKERTRVAQGFETRHLGAHIG